MVEIFINQMVYLVEEMDQNHFLKQSIIKKKAIEQQLIERQIINQLAGE